jgi:hypothetical protein
VALPFAATHSPVGTEPRDPLVAIGIAPAIAKPAIPFAAKRLPATVTAVTDPVTKALVSVLHAVDECDH